jgi:predicted transcriptional regulator
MKYSIIKLYSEGLSIASIAKYCGVSRRTIELWISKNDLRDEMERAREESAKECIEEGLRKLAKGGEEIQEEDSFTYNRRAKRLVECEETGELLEEEYIQPVSKTIKKKIKPPEVKALEVLSRKYYKEFDSKAEERELSTKILEGFTMRELQEARKDNPIDKGHYIEAEFTELSNEESEES